MARYAFRIKLPKASSASLRIDSPHFEWPLGDDLPVLRLSSGGSDVPISDAKVLYFTSDGWPDKDSAVTAGARYVGVLARTFARLRLGVDYGDRAPVGGGFSDWVIRKISEEQGLRVINERPGIMVYESEPAPVFAGGSGALSSDIHVRQFETVFAAALKDPQPLSAHERVAIALYNAAFFEVSQDARFLLNMMALEALIEPGDRSAEARAHVDYLIELTRSSSVLPSRDRDSLCGVLNGLKRESIGQAARALVAQLAGREYAEMQPVAFFTHCYSLRSRLVHGDRNLPSYDEVSCAAANLEIMVSDLLAGELRDVRWSPSMASSVIDTDKSRR